MASASLDIRGGAPSNSGCLSTEYRGRVHSASGSALCTLYCHFGSPYTELKLPATPAFPDTEYTKTTLDNGLRVITSPMPHTRSVAVSIYVGAGSRYETEAEAGISHFIEHLCFKGTRKRPTAQEIS